MTDQTKSALKQAHKASAKQTAERVEASSGLKPPSDSAVAAAQQEGVREAVKEQAKDTYQYLTDGNLASASNARQFTGMDDIMQYAGLLDLGVEDFQQRIENGGPVPEEKVAGLLSLERAGRNRTPYVQAMMKRLKIDHPGEVTNAGPGYTNDVRPITEL